ncbi:retrovirus-related pol polyprotein from transposon TNT 1-94 [Tanacetum coccineum]
MASNEETNAAGTDTRATLWWFESDFDCLEDSYLHRLYTLLKPYVPLHDQKTLRKQGARLQSIVDPWLFSTSNHQLGPSSNQGLMLRCMMCHLSLKPASEMALAPLMISLIALTTTNMFQANHEVAYDSDLGMKAPMADVLSDGQLVILLVCNKQLQSRMNLDSVAETEIDDIYESRTHLYLLTPEAQNVPTEVSAEHSDKKYVSLQLKFQNYKQCIDFLKCPQMHIFEIYKLRTTLHGKDDISRNFRCSDIHIMEGVEGVKPPLSGAQLYKLFLWYWFLVASRTYDSGDVATYLVNFVEKFIGTPLLGYTLNRSLVHTLHGKTYYELLKGKKPNLQYFRVFGSLCYPTNDYDDVGTVHVDFRMNFPEGRCHSATSNKTPETYVSLLQRIQVDDFVLMVDDDEEEIHEFERLDVWILVPCPDNILIIPLKWIFKIKLDEYGDVLKNKARLVAKGYRQEAGIDFEELIFFASGY